MSAKIGLSSSSVYPLKLEETFRLANKLGYDGVEIMVTNETTTQNSDIINQLSKKYEVPVLSIHAPVLLLTHFVWGREPELKLWKSAELARKTGAITVVVHPPFSWQNGYSKNFLSIVDSISALMNVDIAVENMFPWRAKGRIVKAYSPDWDEITNKQEHLTLDFSHAALSGLDSLAFTENHLQQVRHIHLCDGTTMVGTNRRMLKQSKLNGEELEKDKVFDEHLVPGEGTQPVKEVLQLLKDNNWEGSVVAEVSTRKCKTEAQRVDTLTRTLEFARNILS